VSALGWIAGLAVLALVILLAVAYFTTGICWPGQTCLSGSPLPFGLSVAVPLTVLWDPPQPGRTDVRRVGGRPDTTGGGGTQ